MKEQVLILKISLEKHTVNEKTTRLDSQELDNLLNEGWQIKHIQFDVASIVVKDMHSHLIVSVHLQKLE